MTKAIIAAIAAPTKRALLKRIETMADGLDKKGQDSPWLDSTTIDHARRRVRINGTGRLISLSDAIDVIENYRRELSAHAAWAAGLSEKAAKAIADIDRFLASHGITRCPLCAGTLRGQDERRRSRGGTGNPLQSADAPGRRGWEDCAICDGDGLAARVDQSAAEGDAR